MSEIPASSARELSHALLTTSGALVSVVDHDGRILAVNPALADFVGRPAPDLHGHHFWDVYVVPEDVAHAQNAVVVAMAGGRAFPYEGDWLAEGGIRRRVAMRIDVLLDQSGEPYAIATIGIDVTEAHQRFTTDPLTGTRNRAVLFEYLRRQLGAADGGGCSLLFCDVDHFKAVNDQHGHTVGDQLLIEIARRLLEVVRPGDLVARFGGDEFVVLRPGADPDGLTALAASIRERMRPPLQTSHAVLPFEVSIGCATGHPGEDPDELIARADHDMYRIKNRRQRAR